MAVKRAAARAKSPRRPAAAEPASVEAFLSALEHPLKPALELARTAILGASPTIEEGIKWKCPSFRVKGADDFFATLNVHRTKAGDSVLVVFHRGAKRTDGGAKRKDGDAAPQIADPAGLLEWLAKDRCVARFPDLPSAKAGRGPLRAIVKQWITTT